MTGLPKPCLVCGEPAEGTRCPDHQQPDRPARTHALSPARRGYDAAWRKLSARARRLQPWCTDCGATDDLTTDHSPEAWRRHDTGKPIRLQDVDVVCRSCNSRRGPARTRGEGAPATPDTAAWKAESRSHSPAGGAR